MNEAVPERSVGDAADTVKLVLAILLVLAGIAAFYVLRAQADWQRWLAVIAGVLLAVVVFGASARGRAFWQFVLDSRLELRKVVWPTRQETTGTTGAVLAFVIAAGLFLWLMDLFVS